MQQSLFENTKQKYFPRPFDLFSRLIGFENLENSYIGARNCKRYRSSILKFGYSLETNLLDLQEDLKNKTYTHGGYREFIVNDSKKRMIKAAPFRDRVVHHALCNIIEPILDRGFIYDSYACRVGKGSHKAILRLESFIRSIGFSETLRLPSRILKTSRERERERLACFDKLSEASAPRKIYCLKCDIRKYFQNVNHEILLQILRKKIADEEVVWLLEKIIESDSNGIPIGNLTSQLFANLYLNELDHFVKRELKERYYIRYMDDFLILGMDKKHLGLQKERIREFLREKLKLELHPKKAEIFPIDKGLDFLGYVLVNNKRRPRKSTIKRFLKRRKVNKRLFESGRISEESILSSEKSWLGYAKFADSWGLRGKLGI